MQASEKTVQLYENAYEREFTSQVAACRFLSESEGQAQVPGKDAVSPEDASASDAENSLTMEITLDRTCFFPEAGGQLCDRGFLSFADETGAEVRLEVFDVKIEDGIITHRVRVTDKQAAAAASLMHVINEGQSVHGVIDFQRRFDYMQQHTSEHIISGIVHERFGYDNVGFRLSDHTCTMDYDGVLTMADIADIEQAANRVVFDNLEVLVSFPTEAEQTSLSYRSKKEIASDELRIVTIPGIDTCACCAPHVHRTGEIGLIKIIRLQNWKGGVRCSIVAGSRALALFSAEHDMVSTLAKNLSTSWENIPDRFAKMREETGALKKELKTLKKSRMPEDI